MDTWFDSPFGRFRLERLPRTRRRSLRAWDAADKYLLEHLAQSKELKPGHAVLVFNDAFGALATALHAWPLWSVSDSVTAQQAARDNYARNRLDASGLHELNSLQPLPSAPDWVLVKVPKTLALLEWQLHQLRAVLHPGSRVLLAGMMKHLPARAWQLTEQILGPTRTFPGRKKAKLFEAQFDADLLVPDNPYPSHFILESSGDCLLGHANVFSREKLDIGTRFFLRHLPTPGTGQCWLDLGCGNGVLALALLRNQPDITMHCVDESWMAIESARVNLASAGFAQAQFHPAADLQGFPARSIDGIVCNPPFHQQQVIGDFIARQMFADAHRVLRPGGQLWLVANRHLGYRQPLKRLFDGVRVIASNNKFTVFQATKGPRP